MGWIVSGANSSWCNRDLLRNPNWLEKFRKVRGRGATRAPKLVTEPLRTSCFGGSSGEYFYSLMMDEAA